MQTEQKLDAHESITYAWDDREAFKKRVLERVKNPVGDDVAPAILLSALKLYDSIA